MHDHDDHEHRRDSADDWREMLDAMPPWIRGIVSTIEEQVAQVGGQPGTGRRIPPGPPPGDPFAMLFGRGPGPRGHNLPPWGRGRARAGRGDVRASILSLLTEEPMHGYQLMQEMSARSGGVWRPSPGSVYPTLAQLEDEGLVIGEQDNGRRVFRLTDEGRAAAEAADDSPWESVGESVDDRFSSLREEAASTAAAVMAVATGGDAEQVKAAKRILADARKSLYQLLAED